MLLFLNNVIFSKHFYLIEGMNKNMASRFFIFLFFLFGISMVSYTQNTLHRNYIGLQPGLIISKIYKNPNFIGEAKFYPTAGAQMGITYKYFAQSRFMFGVDLNFSLKRNKAFYKPYSGTVYVEKLKEYIHYDDLSTTVKYQFYSIDVPKYVGYPVYKISSFCFNLYLGVIPSVFFKSTESRAFNHAELNETIPYGKDLFSLNGMVGISMDFKLSERLALDISPRYTSDLSTGTLYLPISIIRSIK